MSMTAEQTFINDNTRAGASAPSRRATRDRRLADYIADVVFIVILAAPFVMFSCPSSVLDAVAPDRPAVVAASPEASGP
ncbi:MAG TPA: hypothetical protein VMB76_12805 [Casimicrobiaceae bacterium]|jgi:hypothetical protein|nr:hypothetical protein [Casimicrobiaceae bacterium]